MRKYKKYNECGGAAEYLSQALYIDRQINAKLEKITYYRNLAAKASGGFSTEKVNGKPPDGSRHSRVEYCVCKIIELEKAANDEINGLVDLKSEIEELIKKVERPDYRQLLELRYICCKKWERIAVDMEKSYVHVVHRMYPRALETVENILKTFQM